MSPRLATSFVTPIVTTRLVIRHIFEKDAEALHDALTRQDLEMGRFFCLPPRFYESPETVRDIFVPSARTVERKRDIHYLGIFRKGATDTVVGMIAACVDRERHPRTGYFIGEEHRRKGYAKEAFHATMSTVLRRFSGHSMAYEEVMPSNTASVKLLVSLGLKPTGLRTTALPQRQKHRIMAMQGTLKL